MYLARVFSGLAIDRRRNRIALDQDKIQRERVSLKLPSLDVYRIMDIRSCPMHILVLGNLH